MHILFITPYYPGLKHPTWGIFFHDQVLALHKAGHQVGVLVTPRKDVTLDEVRRRGISKLRATTRDDTHADFPVYRMHWGWAPLRLPPSVALVTGAAAIRAYKAYCRTHGQPDVIHAHNTFYSGYVAARIGEAFHVATVLTEHSSGFLRGSISFPGQKRIGRYTLQNTDVLLTVGRSLADELGRYAPGQAIEIIGNIVDSSFFELAPTAPDPPPFVFIIVASLDHPIKRIDVLLNAFHRAFAGRSDVELHIGGDGALRPELEQLAGSLNLQAQVRFLGRLARDDVRAQIHRSHALVSSSDVETFGLSIAEAMACGRPVVATRSGGPEDFVTERSGILVPPQDVDALAGALQRTVATYSRYDPAAIRDDCVSRFNERVYVARLEEAYRKAIQIHRPVP